MTDEEYADWSDDTDKMTIEEQLVAAEEQLASLKSGLCGLKELQGRLCNAMRAEVMTREQRWRFFRLADDTTSLWAILDELYPGYHPRAQVEERLAIFKPREDQPTIAEIMALGGASRLAERLAYEQTICRRFRDGLAVSVPCSPTQRQEIIDQLQPIAWCEREGAGQGTLFIFKVANNGGDEGRPGDGA